MNFQDCINFQLAVVQNAVFSYFKAALSEYDVTPAQYSLLSCLWDNNGQPPSQLAQRLQLDPSSMSGLLTRTEAKGLITREYCSSDRRTYKILITPRGVSLQKPITEIIESCNHHILNGLSESEYKSLMDCFDRILSNARE